MAAVAEGRAVKGGKGNRLRALLPPETRRSRLTTIALSFLGAPPTEIDPVLQGRRSKERIPVIHAGCHLIRSDITPTYDDATSMTSTKRVRPSLRQLEFVDTGSKRNFPQVPPERWTIYYHGSTSTPMVQPPQSQPRHIDLQECEPVRRLDIVVDKHTPRFKSTPQKPERARDPWWPPRQTLERQQSKTVSRYQ